MSFTGWGLAIFRIDVLQCWSDYAWHGGTGKGANICIMQMKITGRPLNWYVMHSPLINRQVPGEKAPSHHQYRLKIDRLLRFKEKTRLNICWDVRVGGTQTQTHTDKQPCCVCALTYTEFLCRYGRDGLPHIQITWVQCQRTLANGSDSLQRRSSLTQNVVVTRVSNNS